VIRDSTLQASIRDCDSMPDLYPITIDVHIGVCLLRGDKGQGVHEQNIISKVGFGNHRETYSPPRVKKLSRIKTRRHKNKFMKSGCKEHYKQVKREQG
jgi:hypothetical protein